MSGTVGDDSWCDTSIVLKNEVGHTNSADVGIRLVSHAVGDVLGKTSVVEQVEAESAGSAGRASLNGAVGDDSRSDAGVALKDEIGHTSSADVDVGLVSHAVGNVLKNARVVAEVVVQVAGRTG